jgi:hypothetical protein
MKETTTTRWIVSTRTGERRRMRAPDDLTVRLVGHLSAVIDVSE